MAKSIGNIKKSKFICAMQVNGFITYYQYYYSSTTASYTIYNLPACTLVTITVKAVLPCSTGPSSTVTAYTAVDCMFLMR